MMPGPQLVIGKTAPSDPGSIRVVHLPFYDGNPYQTLLIDSLREAGIEARIGGGGGNFFRSALYRWRADILHFHWLHPYLLKGGTWGTISRGGRFLAEIAALKARGIHIVWTVHNLLNHDRRQVNWERRLTRQFARMCDGIICHGEAARQSILTEYGPGLNERITLIPHGHYLDCYPNTVSADAARSELGLEPDDFVLTFLGRIRPYKGLEELLAAFREWDEPRAALLIAGETSDAVLHEQLTAMAAADPLIRFYPGCVDDDRIQTYLNAADAVVLPFRDVLTSGTAILAMSFGRACVAPAVGCLPEHLGHDNILYGGEDCSDLSAALRGAFNQRAELNAVGAANRRRVGDWGWERVARETRRIYETALSRPVPTSGGKE